MSGSLSRFSVLLAEDNSYIRAILATILKDIGFGVVTAVSNGKEAIDYLSLAEKKGALVGQMHNYDLVVSDYVMSPINGPLLLRWVRTSPRSPNRFMPFVMISGAADRAYVEHARDMGVTEFVAKPFSVDAIVQRITAMIQSPRQYVCNQQYFGPDRRRRSGNSPTGDERRREGEAHATIVYSADKVVKPSGASDLWLFRLPNQLKEKAGVKGMREQFQLPDNLLEEAENSLERQSLDFADWAMKYVQKVGKLLEQAEETQEVLRRGFLDEINMIAHELRGQGGTFGYPLITIFGKSLFETTGQDCPETDANLKLIKAHIDAMRAVIRDRISGDGGAIGREILKSIKAAKDKYLKGDAVAGAASKAPPAKEAKGFGAEQAKAPENGDAKEATENGGAEEPSPTAAEEPAPAEAESAGETEEE